MPTDAPLVDVFRDRALWVFMGNVALAIIKQRTERGEFLPGSTGGSAYSRVPAPIGTDMVNQIGLAKLQALVDKEDPEAWWIMTKSGQALIILEGGYEKLRELAGKSTTVNLAWTGAMMRGLKITQVMPGGVPGVDIGWSDPDLARIGRYHNELGAGRSKVTRKFVGMTEAEVSQASDEMTKRLSGKLN